MPPRTQLLPRLQQLVHRPRISRPLQLLNVPASRGYADAKETAQKTIESKGANKDHIPHVSEEAAAMSKITGEKGPDINQGTPVEEIVKGDKEAEKHLPKVMKDAAKQKSNDTPTGSRSFSTSARRHAAELNILSSESSMPPVPLEAGHKFGLPTLPLPPQSHLHRRYDPVVEQVTKLIMRDGKLSLAQRHMSEILTHLRTSPAPSISDNRLLLPNAPPPSQLPLYPNLYLTLAIDSIAPLLRIRAQKGAAGGGAALPIPMPMNLRQRRRQAVNWILEAVDRRKTSLSPFPKRVAEEIISVVEGRSALWERRAAIHRMAVTSRSNLTITRRGRR